jgi:hypothetical protein
MLLKRASKPTNRGFKRKKIDALGSYQEIKAGAKKVEGNLAGFAQNPAVPNRP